MYSAIKAKDKQRIKVSRYQPDDNNFDRRTKKKAFGIDEYKAEIEVINIRCCATATAAIRQGGPWEPESEATLAPASLSLSEAIAKGSASKFALISSARSTHRSAAFLCA